MKYFAKYLPVKGEIKEGDKFFSKYIFGELVTLNSSTPIHTCHWIQKDMKVDNITTDGLYLQPKEDESEAMSWRIASQKVKLFLCGRDIQVGDEVTYVDADWPAMGMYCGRTKEKCDNPGELNPDRLRWTKVIGEISSEATWATEGMEYEEDEWELWGHHKEGFIVEEINKLSLNQSWLIVDYCKLKGPCGHFH